MAKQKFERYDLVRIAKDLGPHMSHFTSDVDAIIMGSYDDECGDRERGFEAEFDEERKDDDDEHEYEVFIQGKGETAWYQEDQLTLIKSNQKEMLGTWKKELKKKVK